MSLAWMRRATGAAGWLALASAFGTAGAAAAADSLPPLRVDPVLLGGAPLKPAPAPTPVTVEAPAAKDDTLTAKPPAKREAAAEKPAAPSPTGADMQSTAAKPAAQASAKPETTLPVAPPSTADVTPVTPPPATRALPPATPPAAPVQKSVAPATPAAPVEARAQAVVPAPLPRLVPPASASAAAPAASAAPRLAAADMPSGARNLPLLRVDPALLGAAPIQKQAAMDVQPPQVAERPALAPLYSAHVAAGLLPPPAAKPGEKVDMKTAPTYLTANRIDGVNDVEVVADGMVQLQRGGDHVHANHLVYRQDKDEIEAEGNVHLFNQDSSITGPRMRLQMGENLGEFVAPAYVMRYQPAPEELPALTMTGLPVVSSAGKALVTSGEKVERPPIVGSGTADVLEFRGEDKYHLSKATYSTCTPEKRDWELVTQNLDLDYSTQVGEARDATMRFKDVPLFYTPWISFPLSSDRKTGFLAPTIGSTSKSGFEATIPWYWNIAPNMDATIAPRLMTKRGTQFNGEFRYLDTTYNGLWRAEYLPNDQLTDTDRYGYAIKHWQALGGGFSAALNLNGVSDDTYFSDLSTRVSQISQGNLLRQAMLVYGGPWYGATLNFQTFQTLQDPSNPSLVTPYRRLPQLTGFANRHDLPLGLTFNLNAEYVDFDHPTMVLGKRTTIYPQLSLPLATEAFWLTPKIGFQSTRYELDRQGTLPAEISRSLPILSVDSGFTMDRPFEWSGRNYLQTLEPRAYYLYVPRRDQSKIPVFDTAIADFNYAQLFSENRYAGGDRIADANHLTLAVTSRLIDPASGSELIRASLGQRYYFSDQYVTLPGETARTYNTADLLAALSGQIMPKTYADFGWQHNPQSGRTERLTAGVRYMPLTGKILNASYRYARDQLGQIDISGQWPLFGGWNAVGRYNYSTKERRLIETIGGMEYNGGCWTARFVVQRLAAQADSTTNAVFFQLELSEIARIGSNPLDLLKRSIPGYGIINQPTADPVFAAQ